MENRKGVSIESVIILMMTTALIVYGIMTYLQMKKEMNPLLISEEEVVYSGDFAKLKRVMGIIQKDYLREYDEKKLEEGAIRGLLNALDDPYTTYFDKEETESFLMETEGDYEGVGMYVSYDTKKDTVIVLLPIEGSPAEEAGILPGDYVLEINGVSVVGVSLEEVASRLRGKSGSTVEIKFERIDASGESEIFEKKITRRKVELTGFKYKVIEDDIGYITFLSFDENVEKKFDEAYQELIKKQKVKGLIIDLRDNPGGLLNVATDVADRLLPMGKIVYTVDKNGKEEVTYSDSKSVDIPIVVLINNNSASASEIMAAAIKDYGGTIVGEKSYGKGVVQEFKRLYDGTYVKVTISEYFSPNGTKIDKIGVEPQVEIEDDKETPEDEQLEKAVEVIQKLMP